MKLVSVAEAQANLPSLLEDSRNERIVVARDGDPVGVLLSISDYLDWARMTEDELTTLFSSPEVQAKLRRAEHDYASGRTISHEEVGSRLEVRSRIRG